MTAEEEPLEDAEATLADTSRPHGMVVASNLASRCLANWRPIVLTALVIAAVALAAGLFLFQYRPDRQVDDAAADRAVRAASDGAVALLSYSSAVSQLRPDSAVVLEFVNESTRSIDKKDPLMTPSVIRVTLAKVDGSWLISKLDPVG